ncbi:Imm1 family immunity protein [Streptomyces shenzhenensis]|uniref:Imm1 family immunity protein n=1 Tax=Streptomyces shenzhenensis TaxID=943815 RepID=UPI0038170295
MIVAGSTHRGDTFARSEREVDALVDRIINDLRQSGRTADGFEIMPERAVVCIMQEDEKWPSNHLYVTVNKSNGYGALRWWTDKAPEGAAGDHISRFIWTSGSPNPPAFDPQLILDPPTPLYYPREAAIPISEVREALEELCRKKTGERPTCISWQLLDQTV